MTLTTLCSKIKLKLSYWTIYQSTILQAYLHSSGLETRNNKITMVFVRILNKVLYFPGAVKLNNNYNNNNTMLLKKRYDYAGI